MQVDMTMVEISSKPCAVMQGSLRAMTIHVHVRTWCECEWGTDRRTRLMTSYTRESLLMISRNFIHRAADRLTSQRLIVDLCSWLAQREPGEPSWASLPGSKAINCTFLNSVIPVTNSGLAADRTKEIGSTPSDSAAAWLGWRHAPYRELSYAMHGAVNACSKHVKSACGGFTPLGTAKYPSSALPQSLPPHPPHGPRNRSVYSPWLGR